MKQMRYLILTILAAIGLTLTSCIEDDFTTASTDILSFSTDTLSFDTVFTEQGTPTARLKVFNRAKKSINISSITLREASSRFAINVDGQSGSSFHDIEIRGGDSIFLFVECLPSPSPGNEPVLIEDAIVFLTNGVRQEVTLEAWGQNVTRLYNHRITSDTRFTADRPIVIFDSLIVEKGAKLTIDPGTQLLFHDKASLTVRGSIQAIGSPGKTIAMRGDRLDNVLPDISYDILAGQWQGVTIEAESFDNRLEYVDMRSTVQGLRVDSCSNLSRSKLLLLNSRLHNSQGSALECRYAKVEAYGCVFSEAAGHVVELHGGVYDFAQCTFANYYLFAAPSRSIIGLYHLLPDNEEAPGLPLMKANFSNSIIYGLGSPINVGDLEGSSVFMRYILFGVNGEDDANLINCIWDADPLFYTVREDYYFNYHVKPDSPAIGAGDPALVKPLFLYDPDGIDRLRDGNPTLGAYQYQAPENEE